MDSSWNWTTTKSGTYRGGRELRDEAPEGSVESDLPESGHIMQGIGEGIDQIREPGQENLRAEMEGGSSCVTGGL